MDGVNGREWSNCICYIICTMTKCITYRRKNLKIFNIITSILFCLTISKTLIAQSKAELKHELLVNSTKQITVQFSQTSYKKLRNRKQVRKGTAYFSKPNKFRWNFDKSKNGVEEYCYNGKLLSHYQSYLNEVTHYSTNKGLSRDLC